MDKIRKALKLRRFHEIDKPSKLIAYLYDIDEFYRFRAAEALGYLCRNETARNFILRLFWHLSDESGAYCIGAPLGIAEIGRSNPDVFIPFKNKFVSLLDNWEIERKYVAYGIGRVAELLRDADPNPAEKLLSLVFKLDAEFKAYALFALYRLDTALAVDVAEMFTNANDIVRYYDGERVRVIELSEIARLIRTYGK